MKTLRRINAVAWGVIAAILLICGSLSWEAQGVGTASLIAGMFIWAGFPIGFGYVIDKCIREHYEDK